ncbi:serine hydrolase [Bacillus salacetis]|uniref:serine hydrolase n=1 Tax=Bacillus salacetis TaxID=2315464 RepID=UPI003B9E6186
MYKVLNKLKEINEGKAGLLVYSTQESIILESMNKDLTVPLASAAKVAIGYCITNWVEIGKFNWNSFIENISFNPSEDSYQLYPHLQGRNSLSLREAVEVMIACHDSYIASSVVRHCGGWELLNQSIQEKFPTIKVTENPRDGENLGQLDDLLQLMLYIFEHYKKNPNNWSPVINGLVRQKGEVEGIPAYHLNHMTGGLDNVVVDIGILGEFKLNPFIFAIGAIDLPDRANNNLADLRIIEAMKLLYENQKHY